MKELVVYYRGFTASCKVPSVNPERVAKDLLRDLVVEHYFPMHTVTSLKRLDQVCPVDQCCEDTL